TTLSRARDGCARQDYQLARAYLTGQPGRRRCRASADPPDGAARNRAPWRHQRRTSDRTRRLLSGRRRVDSGRVPAPARFNSTLDDTREPFHRSEVCRSTTPRMPSPTPVSYTDTLTPLLRRFTA